LSVFFAVKLLCTLTTREREFGTTNVTYLCARRQENYGRKRKSRGENSSLRAAKSISQLRFKAIFVKFKSNQGMIRTKTAILSIADLKAENLTVLREAFKALPGVEKIDFNLERSVAVLEFDPSQSHIDDFLRAALKAGFKVL
jgi:hypothetical protein